MGEERKGHPRNRPRDSQPPVMEREPRSEEPAYGTPPAAGRGRRLPRVLALVILVAFALIVARQEIPAVADWWARAFTPAEWGVRQTCRQAARADLRDRRYVRLLRAGKLHHTQDGPYVTRMTFSVLGEDGGRETVAYQCYLDNNGQVFRLERGSE